ncbi:alpha/beta hydrolase [Kordia sp. YSTF-M3]|uniref:Alpha/beta hydrolase n=1 Tax=Kordia aestuariivivens TaxID=2759037 RepID=A0ABR7QD12_9FLAO|nr:alpha/beta hydrolase [Kordia aestuariivivens]MBC8756447.1 alpha/beta hydrolase [Kordia aestuariivivens]
MKIILIPGLAFDCRIFENLDLSGYEVEHLNWIEPKTNEKIHEYSQRLFSKIEPSSEKVTLIGHSLGGIVSQEIASAHNIEKVILISSIQSRKELPFSFKLVKPLRLDVFFTKGLCVKTVRFWGKGHGFETENEQNLFKSMVGNQTNRYLQWALRELSTWHEPTIPAETEIIHIHGTNDKTLPYKLVKKTDFTIENGTHICVLKRAAEISALIKNVL